jgi:hypothetical protein
MAVPSERVAVISDMHAILRFVGDRADFGLGVVFLRDGADEPDDWPAVFEQLNVLDPDTEHPDFRGLVDTGLLDIQDAFRELRLKMRFPADGPSLEWSGHDEEARRVIDRAADLGHEVWKRFSAS